MADRISDSDYLARAASFASYLRDVSIGGVTVTCSSPLEAPMNALRSILEPFAESHAARAAGRTPVGEVIVGGKAPASLLASELSWKDRTVYAGSGVKAARHGDHELIYDDKSGDLTVNIVGEQRIFYFPNNTVNIEHLGHLVKMPIRRDFARRGWLGLHASVFVLGETAVACIGEKGSGKTSLLLRALASGAAYLANDTAYCRISSRQDNSTVVEVLGWPNMIRIGEGTLSDLEFHPIREQLLSCVPDVRGPRVAADQKYEFYAGRLSAVMGRPIKLCTSAHLSALIFLEGSDGDGGTPRWRRMGPAELQMALESAICNHPGVDWLDLGWERDGSESLQATISQLSLLPAWQLRLHPRSAKTAVRDLIERQDLVGIVARRFLG